MCENISGCKFKLSTQRNRILICIQTYQNWCNHTFPIDLARNGIPFGNKAIGKMLLQSISLCVDR